MMNFILIEIEFFMMNFIFENSIYIKILSKMINKLFIFLDATYVERYMGDAESEAFHHASLLSGLKTFHNVSSYLLVHGTADGFLASRFKTIRTRFLDNVHYQNTADLIRALVDEGIQFEMMAYTDEFKLHLYSLQNIEILFRSHDLTQGRWHLYNLLIS
jgi:hypothetical protein